MKIELLASLRGDEFRPTRRFHEVASPALRNIYKARTSRAKKNTSPLSADFGYVAKEFIPSLRCAALILMALFAGCGSNAPTAPAVPPVSPLQTATFTYVKQSDLNAYLQALGNTLPDFYLIVEEQTILFNDWGSGRTNDYWTGVYANNLILRIRAYSRRLGAIHPASPDLKQLHGQLLTGMGTLDSAIGDFITAVNTSDVTFIDQANQEIGQFNAAINIYSIGLSNLAGQTISLFPSQ